MPDELTVREQLAEAIDLCLSDLECLSDDLTYSDSEDDMTRQQAGDAWVVLRMTIRRLQSVEGLVEPARGVSPSSRPDANARLGRAASQQGGEMDGRRDDERAQ